MISVLIVDDHALLRAGMRSRLEREVDINVVGEAATAEQALITTRTLHPDVVLLDLLLPRKSGYDAIPELVRQAPSSRVLVVSSQAAPSWVRRALSAGAAGYLPKRASDQELVAGIRRIASGEGYVDPDLGSKLVVDSALPALAPLSERERDVLHLHHQRQPPTQRGRRVSCRAELQHEFVEIIPPELAGGVLYISIGYATAAHLCFCGCGTEINTPLSPTDWQLTFDGVSASLDPSVGNWSLACQSHYWIERNRVRWAPPLGPKQIAAGRDRDRRAKDVYFGETRAAATWVQHDRTDTTPTGSVSRVRQVLRRIGARRGGGM